MVSMPRTLILVAALAASVPVSGRHIVTTKITWPREVARIVYRVVWRGAGKAARRDDPPFTQKTPKTAEPISFHGRSVKLSHCREIRNRFL